MVFTARQMTGGYGVIAVEFADESAGVAAGTPMPIVNAGGGEDFFSSPWPGYVLGLAVRAGGSENLTLACRVNSGQFNHVDVVGTFPLTTNFTHAYVNPVPFNAGDVIALQYTAVTTADDIAVTLFIALNFED